MNNKTTDLASPIRLPNRVDLPSPKDVADMVERSRNNKQRVELPWHPSGRPSPVVLAVHVDENSGKAAWSLHDGEDNQAPIVWRASDPQPMRVAQAMQDWYTVARLTEGWQATAPEKKADSKPTAETKPAAESKSPKDSKSAAPTKPGSESKSGQSAKPQPAPTGANTNPAELPPNNNTPAIAFPTLSMQLEYAHLSSGQPTEQGQAGETAGEPQPFVLPAEQGGPSHWVHGASPTPPVAQPLSPEMWANQPAAPAAAPSGELMLGDVLVTAGVIPTRTLQAALTLQNSASQRRRIGEILVTSGALPDKVLKAAVELQDMARKGKISKAGMTELLVRVQSSDVSVEELLAQRAAAKKKKTRPSDELLEREGRVSEEDQKKLKRVMGVVKTIDFSGDEGKQKAEKLLDLLKTATLITDETIKDVKKAPNISDAVKALLIKEVVDPVSFEAALDCQKLIDADHIKPEQAVIAIGYCQRTRVNLKEAISEMNWTVPTDLL